MTLADGKIDQGLAGGIFRFRTDGSGFERVCGGGFDNPVEIDFTEEGEMLGTVNILHGNPRQDCLVHWVEGGVYPRADQEQCIAEFKRTGDLLPPVKELGHVAVAGMTRYRSEAFGPEYRNSLFISFFNRHKVIRSILERSGSTFTSREEEFLSSEDKDFHPTDVLEDADGSLLVINTGGWFRIGCPVSEIARPDMLGAIYRVRKKGMKRGADQWGVALHLSDRPVGDLVGYLDDSRQRVRQQAVEILAGGGRQAVAALGQVVGGPLRPAETGFSAESRGRAIAALANLDLENDSGILRAILRRANEGDRIVFARGLGMRETADEPTLVAHEFAALHEWVVSGSPPLRREAATALGRLCRPWKSPFWSTYRAPAVAALFESLAKNVTDRTLEHALIFGLIQINDRRETLPLLQDPNPQIRRVALIALDQMDDGNLTREEVTPLLDTDDPQLRNAALAVISSRKGWATELVRLLRGWLQEDKPSEEHLSLLRGTLLAQAADPTIQQLIAEALAGDKTSPPVRLLLWEVICRAPVPELPEFWLAAIQRTLLGASPAEIRQVIGIVNERKLERFDEAVLVTARNKEAASDLRIEALAAVARRLRAVDDAAFALLIDHVKVETPPLVLLAAARALADAPLGIQQLRELSKSLSAAGPLALPILLRAYQRTDDEAVGLGLVAALNRSPAAENLS
ncbi:MAG: hypothetical protein ACM3U2_05295, partial [Deltaproteobacteria bacterium]